MNNGNIFLYNFFKLFKFFERKQKFDILFCVFMMVIASFLEVLSIGALIPFVVAFLEPEKLFNYSLINSFIEINDLKNFDLQFVFTVIFVLTIIFSNLFRVYVLYLVIKLSKTLPIKLASEMYKKTILTNYQDIKKRNSSELVSLITEKIDAISAVFFGFFYGCTALIIMLGILSLLFFIDFKITLISISVTIFLYLIMGSLVRNRIKKNSVILSQSSISRIKHVKETFGALKQLILYDSQELFSKTFNRYDKNFRLTQFKTQFLSTFPRFFVEAVGIVSISILVYFYSKVLNYESVYVITLVGALAFAAQRLLPLVNTIYSSYISLAGSSSYINETLLLMEQRNNSDSALIENQNKNIKLDFNEEIILKNINFNYKSQDVDIIKSFNLRIKKGSNVIIIGKTGSGKSTLLDIIMGLLDPIDGHIEVDGIKITKNNKKNWQNKISHVPQETFLFDNTIYQNIVFGISENIDKNKVIESAKLAEIHEFIETLPKKYETIVGENGVLLSGGQRQRIGIARALFKEREILTLDEATNALDMETEEKILENINKKMITIIQITHRDIKNYGYDNIIRM